MSYLSSILVNEELTELPWYELKLDPVAWPFDSVGPPAIDTDDLVGSNGTKANSFPIESMPEWEERSPSSDTSRRICEQEMNQEHEASIEEPIPSKKLGYLGI